MDFPLRQSTASQEIILGKFVDVIDGDTPETGLTIANTDIKIWKYGATALVNKNSGGATHMAAGMYSAVLDATDTNTLGALEIVVHVAGALYVTFRGVVLPAQVFDAFFMNIDRLPVHVMEIADDVITGPSILNGAFSTNKFGTGAFTAATFGDSFLTAAKVAPDAGAEIAVAVRTELATELGRIDGTVSSRASQATLDTLDNYVDTEVAAIVGIVTAVQAKTDLLPAQPAAVGSAMTLGTDAVSAAAMSAAAVAEIQSGLATASALATVSAFLDTEVAAILAAVDTEVAAIKLKTDLIPAAPAAVGDVPTAAQNAAGLLDLANAIETGLTVRGLLRVLGSAGAGKVSGAATTSMIFRNAVADTKPRITATVTPDGDRTAVTIDAT